MITVYHGSNIILPEPSLDFGKAGTDFGSGFYIPLPFQAGEFSSCSRRRLPKC